MVDVTAPNEYAPLRVATPQGAFYEQLGQRLATARRTQRLTQERLGDSVDLSRTSITNIEKGRQIVPAHLLAKFAQTLNVSILELLPPIEAVRPSHRVERELDALEPYKRDWAKKILALGRTEEKDTNHATSLRTRPKKGRRAVEGGER
jgi:transcriptional regulator with XRE-family HTH domain